MLKRNFKIVAILAITLSLGSGFVTAHAATASSTTENVEYKINSKANFCNPVYSILENKLEFTKTQIDDAAKAGKTAFDLAKEKGMTEDQLKNAIIDAKSQKIDQMVAEGEITKDEATAIKTNLASKIKNWNGSLKQHKGGHFNIVYSVLETKGFTKAQIDDAAKAGKTAFDLAKEKGMTADQLRATIIDTKSKKIDQMVTEGKITKEKADTIKSNLTTKIKNWDGGLTHKPEKTKSN
jgi:polyhydroxyalkanoate synthesis regulator phasin